MPHYLICYDICDPKRLSRLHRRLKKRALALQYSVFLLRADRRAVDPLMTELTELIDEKVDDLRCYRLPNRGFAVRLGAAVLPEGLHLTALPATMYPSWRHEDDDRHGGEAHETSDRSQGRSGGETTPRPSGRSTGSRSVHGASSTRHAPRQVRPLRRRGVYRL